MVRLALKSIKFTSNFGLGMLSCKTGFCPLAVALSLSGSHSSRKMPSCGHVADSLIYSGLALNRERSLIVEEARDFIDHYSTKNYEWKRHL